jgi:hypothetical protein
MLPKQRVKFETANGHFHGFHERYFKQKHSEEFFLSVGTDGTNIVEAKLPGRRYLHNGVTVTYDGGPFLLDVPPVPPAPLPPPAETIQAIFQDQILTVHGLPSAGILRLDTLFPLKANRNQTGHANTTKIGVLGVQSMPRREFNLIVHFVTSSVANPACQDPVVDPQGHPILDAQGHQIQAPNPFLIPKRAKGNLDGILDGINAIWEPQANVHFTMALPANLSAVPGQVSYSTIGIPYDRLPPNPDGTPNPDCRLSSLEQIDVYAAVHSQSRNDIDVYFVHAFDLARANARVLGQALVLYDPINHPQRALFVSDVGGIGPLLVQLLAHEIGHTLGLNHNADSNLDLVHNIPPTACNVPINPFIDNGNGDSDFKDNSSLMWCFSKEDRTHIGAPLWFQLNQKNPLP